ncbi:tRNA adenosine(34) deaminase TadA [Mycoplasmatota bacterium]|nr:tRNA adenosine(34) deaminase TadA [Mycoplasmatota bacterium]
MEDFPMYFMKEAIEEAKKAYALGEVPVGAVIVKDDEIIARAHNLRESTQYATHHAEIIAINEACRKLNTWRLNDCDLYVTLEPCMMCAGALILSRINKVYFGASDPKFGSVVSVTRVLDIKKYNHQVLYEGGILGEACAGILKEFFKSLRLAKKD